MHTGTRVCHPRSLQGTLTDVLQTQKSAYCDGCTAFMLCCRHCEASIQLTISIGFICVDYKLLQDPVKNISGVTEWHRSDICQQLAGQKKQSPADNTLCHLCTCCAGRGQASTAARQGASKIPFTYQLCIPAAELTFCQKFCLTQNRYATSRFSAALSSELCMHWCMHHSCVNVKRAIDEQGLDRRSCIACATLLEL